VDDQDVDIDKEPQHKKSRFILSRLQWGEYDNYWVEDKSRYPFCMRPVETDFNSIDEG
jgi:hypothetical protein